MQNIIQIVRKYPFSCFFIVLIWYLSFFTPPHTDLDNVRFIDKWIHILMYGGTCMIIWIEYLCKHNRINKKKLVIGTWIAPITMSACIELLQAYCTQGRRSGDWLDLAANATGVTLAAIIGCFLTKYLSRDNKDSCVDDHYNSDDRQ